MTQLYVLMRIEDDIDSEVEVRGVYDSVEKAKAAAKNECVRTDSDWEIDTYGCDMLQGSYIIHSEGPIEVECCWWITPCELNQAVA